MAAARAAWKAAGEVAVATMRARLVADVSEAGIQPETVHATNTNTKYTCDTGQTHTVLAQRPPAGPMGVRVVVVGVAGRGGLLRWRRGTRVVVVR